jgi:hypothetical protein
MEKLRLWPKVVFLPQFSQIAILDASFQTKLINTEPAQMLPQLRPSINAWLYDGRGTK